MKVLFAIAALTAAISASPVPIPDSSVSEVEEAPGKLFARADKLCRVEVKDQYVNCRRCPFTSCESVARFYPSSRFTVTCRHVGEYITNTEYVSLVDLYLYCFGMLIVWQRLGLGQTSSKSVFMLG